MGTAASRSSDTPAPLPPPLSPPPAAPPPPAAAAPRCNGSNSSSSGGKEGHQLQHATLSIELAPAGEDEGRGSSRQEGQQQQQEQQQPGNKGEPPPPLLQGLARRGRCAPLAAITLLRTPRAWPAVSLGGCR